MNHSEIVSFLWGVADLIRDTFKRGTYQDVILPHGPATARLRPRTDQGEGARHALKNFACIEVHAGKGVVRTFVKVDPDTIALDPELTRDVRKIGHYGTGDLEITIRSREDLGAHHGGPRLHASHRDSGK